MQRQASILAYHIITFRLHTWRQVNERISRIAGRRDLAMRGLASRRDERQGWRLQLVFRIIHKA
jgi:hypothetical protein